MATTKTGRTLNLKHPEVYRLASALARETGETMTEAVRRSLEERLGRVRAAPDEVSNERRARRILELATALRERAPAGYFDQDLDAMLYDEDGLPR